MTNFGHAKGRGFSIRTSQLIDDLPLLHIFAPAFVPLPSAAPRPAARGYVADDDETGYVEPVFVSRAKSGPEQRQAPAGLITWVSDPATLAPSAKIVDQRAYSVVCDHLGTPVLMLNETGQRVWEAEVSSWGDVRVLRGDAADCPHRFAGQVEDVETGLYYNRYRYYDPAAGQYLCVDPIRLAGGLNSFAYVGDPLTELDPLGLAKSKGNNCGAAKGGGGGQLSCSTTPTMLALPALRRPATSCPTQGTRSSRQRRP